jgi:ubiquitin
VKEETGESSDAVEDGNVNNIAAQACSQNNSDELPERAGASGRDEDSGADLFTQHWRESQAH